MTSFGAGCGGWSRCRTVKSCHDWGNASIRPFKPDLNHASRGDVHKWTSRHRPGWRVAALQDGFHLLLGHQNQDTSSLLGWASCGGYCLFPWVSDQWRVVPKPSIQPFHAKIQSSWPKLIMPRKSWAFIPPRISITRISPCGMAQRLLIGV